MANQATKHHQARYGQWAGNPNGKKADPSRCAAEIRTAGRWGLYQQCSRKCGHGPDGAFCKQHAKANEPAAAHP